MEIIGFLLKSAGRRVVAISFIGLISGLSSAGLLALINSGLHDQSMHAGLLAAGFVLLVAGKVLSGALSQQMLFNFSHQTTLQLSLDLSRDLVRSSVRQVEKIGSAKITAVLLDDVQVLAAALQSAPTLIVNIAVLAGCSVYLVWLSWQAFVTLAILASLGVLLYRSMLRRTQGFLETVRKKRDALFCHFRTLTEGIKELRINRLRREDLVERQIVDTVDDLDVAGRTAIRIYVWTDSLTQLVFYTLLGSLLFIVPALAQLPISALTGYVFTSIYVMGPIWALIYTVPTLQRGQIAFNRIETFKQSLQIEPEAPVPARSVSRFKTLEMRNVAYSFNTDENTGKPTGFVLGPVNFDLAPGELVFIIGGNGSGKSTLVKLLCGLYSPVSGDVYIDGKLVTEETRDAYRQYFSVVFSDFYLFDSVLGLSDPQQEKKAREYLRLLQLDKKVTIDDGKFSTIALSQGQRRRLALLTTYLEDRPIYIFDEWAADQDPAYKEVFYKSLLPDLRSKGKAVVVITHDDRYFGYGDRVIRLDYGKISNVTEDRSLEDVAVSF